MFQLMFEILLILSLAWTGFYWVNDVTTGNRQNDRLTDKFKDLLELLFATNNVHLAYTMSAIKIKRHMKNRITDCNLDYLEVNK